MDDRRVVDAAEAAQDSFWRTVREYFPDAPTKEVPAYIEERFRELCEQAVGWWAASNDA